ncbi:alpha/beta hydrolase [Streptomyces sp. NPDC051776]|uniref:alpha/beta fold hydrolase n=1 Tax=Streptomyces sp. NPDC051776 TaxID=3155414 RepID=UPI003433D39F
MHTKRLVTEDSTLAYATGGVEGGPPLVLVHGWSGSRAHFDGLLPRLTTCHHVIAIDLPGHGNESRSERRSWTVEAFAQDVAAVLDAEHIESAVLAGHSMGAAVVLETARLAPHRVRHVVALDSLTYLQFYPRATKEETAAVTGPFRSDFPAAVDHLVESFSSEDTDPGFRRMLTRDLRAVEPGTAVDILDEVMFWDLDSALAATDAPVTVLAVEKLLAPEAIEHYGHRMDVVPVGLGGHWFLMESPDATAILLQGIAGAGTTAGGMPEGPVRRTAAGHLGIEDRKLLA